MVKIEEIKVEKFVKNKLTLKVIFVVKLFLSFTRRKK
jgi:hypothetical protein